MWSSMYCQILIHSQSMYTPPRLVVKQSGSMGGVFQTFGKCEFLVISVLPYDDVILKNYYIQYCKTLTSVIKEAKKELLTLPIK